ncbi:addiction module antitoxin [Thioalkalivibrio denitrificans]|uniref:Addiction module antitoxin n=1 Tax=Thioalkalivibrio denitrificans TaxID=108003 RepID=A0A1V3NCS6_9GAMM|nr:addiction module antitoxin [Thioalkalivibrio denitrificans]OOG22668.1 addiction module antitoxin [Thioalkalivibrio denitrificans]
MKTLHVSLPDCLTAFIQEQVRLRGYRTPSEYVCDLVQRDLDRHKLRSLMLAGAGSARAIPADRAYFDSLRVRVRRGTRTRR